MRTLSFQPLKLLDNRGVSSFPYIGGYKWESHIKKLNQALEKYEQEINQELQQEKESKKKRNLKRILV